MNFLHDTGIWVLISFLIFAGVAYRFGWKALLTKLDGRINQIRADIETAEKLKAEAQILYDQYTTHQKEAAREAQHIIDRAKETARQIREQAEIDLKETIKRREEQLEERLRRMEEQTVADIRNYAAELAVKATTEIVAARLDPPANDRLIEAAVKKISGTLA